MILSIDNGKRWKAIERNLLVWISDISLTLEDVWNSDWEIFYLYDTVDISYDISYRSFFRPGTTTGVSSRRSDSRLNMALNLRQKSSFTFNMLWSLSETQMLKRRLQCWNEEWILEAISWVFKRQLQSWILFSVFELVWCWMQRNCFVPKSSYLNRKHNG